MAKTTRVCRYKTCKKTGQMSEMTQRIKNGRPEWYCPECFEKQTAEEEFKRKESDELTDLIENYVKPVHKVQVIPPTFYSYLSEVRNGTELFGKKAYHYKEGYPYPIIAETYKRYWKEVRSRVRWAKNNGKVKMQNGVLDELRFGLNVIKQYVSVVADSLHEQKLRDEAMQSRQNEMEYTDTHIPTPDDERPKYRKPAKKAHDDISDILQDD